jgi:threonine/homoserine/homoserine lactone efflux protein
MSLEFFVTALVVVVVPGTGVIYTVSVALGGGRRRGLIAAVGCTLGIVPHLLAAVFGLSGFMHAGALAFRILKYAGVAYLLFLAVTIARPGSSEGLEGASGGGAGAGKVIVRGILLNLLNPKLTLFFFAFLPQFLTVDAGTAPLLGLGAVFMVLTLLVFALYAVAAARLRGALSSRTRARRRVERSMAAILAGLAVRLAVASE